MVFFLKKKNDNISNSLNMPDFPGESNNSTSEASSLSVPDDIPMQLPKFPEDNNTKSDSSLEMPTNPDENLNLGTSQLSTPQENNDVLSSVPNFNDNNSTGSSNNEGDHMTHTMVKDPSNPFEGSSGSSIPSNVSEPSTDMASVSDSLATEKQQEVKAPIVGELDHFESRDNLILDSPIFVNVIDFAQMLESMANCKSGTKKANNNYMRIKNIIQDQDVQYSEYNNSLEDIQKKLIYVDKVLFEN